MKRETSGKRSVKSSPVCIHHISVFQPCEICDKELNTPLPDFPLQALEDGETLCKSLFTLSHIISCPQCGEEIPIFDEHPDVSDVSANDKPLSN